MTDREQLELASKACGLEEAKMRIEFNQWNPLEDDGDALRLAVKLGLLIQINSGSATAWKWRGENWYEQASDYADDMDATTRRAIVRAAAEIGKAMP